MTTNTTMMTMMMMKTTMMMTMMIMMMMMMLLMDMETIRISTYMLNWKCKIHNTQNQSGTSFKHIRKEFKLTI